MAVEPSRRYRIGFISEWDANDPSEMSGAAFYMRRAFRQLGHETVDVFPTSKAFRARMLLGPGYLARLAYRARGFYYSPKRSASYIAAVSNYANRAIARAGRLDFVFSQSGMPVGGLDTTLPVIMTSDQIFRQYLDGYVAHPAKRFVREGEALEKAVVSRVTRYIYPSAWAKSAFCQAHPSDRHLAECIPWGANLINEPDALMVERDIAAKSRAKTYRFLFVGSDWERKRGAFVLQTVDQLRQDGFDIELDVVGAGQVDVDGRSYVTVTKYIDKLTPEGSAEFSRLMRAAHFLFVPSRAEAYGHVFCEAAAFGVPSLSTAVGGIPSIIKHDVNGLCLPLKTTPAQFADAIGEILTTEGRYCDLSRTARASFEADLSWKAFATKTLELVSSALTARLTV